MTVGNNQKITAAILAGGKSQRMGTNKAFLLIDEEPIISHTITTLRKITHDLLIVTNHPELYAGFQAKAVRDLQLGLGPIGAILTALTLAEN
ncbi:TPA: molybdenum cofactor guanylyltransferase, partial [Candidatus Poribacteria bacterium]|nr:molybdenum cofactor guanylyltransferase [Candidatus Poribacteria bacterium]